MSIHLPRKLPPGRTTLTGAVTFRDPTREMYTFEKADIVRIDQGSVLIAWVDDHEHIYTQVFLFPMDVIASVGYCEELNEPERNRSSTREQFTLPYGG